LKNFLIEGSWGDSPVWRRIGGGGGIGLKLDFDFSRTYKYRIFYVEVRNFMTKNVIMKIHHRIIREKRE